MPRIACNPIGNFIFSCLLLTLSKATVLRTDVSTCIAQGSGHYFDVPSLTCMQCSGIQVPSPSGVDCICPSNAVASYSILSGTNAPALQCTACTSPLVATQTRSACIGCGVAASMNATSALQPSALQPANCSATASALVLSSYTSAASCSCPPGYVLTDFNITGDLSANMGKYCLLCPFNSYVDSSDSYKCRPCPDPRMRRDRSSGLCKCPDGQVEDSAVAAGTSTVDASIVGLHVCVDSAAVQGKVLCRIRSALERKGCLHFLLYMTLPTTSCALRTRFI